MSQILLIIILGLKKTESILLKILGSQEVDLSLNVNNVSYSLKLEPRVTLLDALRENLGLMGTKKACDRGECGACIILVNGRRINSYMTLGTDKK